MAHRRSGIENPEIPPWRRIGFDPPQAGPRAEVSACRNRPPPRVCRVKGEARPLRSHLGPQPSSPFAARACLQQGCSPGGPPPLRCQITSRVLRSQARTGAPQAVLGGGREAARLRGLLRFMRSRPAAPGDARLLRFAVSRAFTTLRRREPPRPGGRPPMRHRHADQFVGPGERPQAGAANKVAAAQRNVTEGSGP
jgi:hypothetical protein